MIGIKLISISVVGISGVLGSASPLLHIGSTKSDWKTKWHERSNFSQPIFENCKYQNKNPLNVYLAFAGGANTSVNNKKVSLKVVEKNDDGEKIVWGEGANNSESDVWDKLNLQYSGDKKVKFMYPVKENWGEIRTYISNCDNEKVEFALNTEGSRSSIIEFKNITLNLSDGEQCSKNFSNVECDINIGPADQIKWKEGFKPKVIYTAF